MEVLEKSFINKAEPWRTWRPSRATGRRMTRTVQMISARFSPESSEPCAPSSAGLIGRGPSARRRLRAIQSVSGGDGGLGEELHQQSRTMEDMEAFARNRPEDDAHGSDDL